MQAKRRSYLTRVLGFLALLLALNAVSLTGWNIPGLGVKPAEAGGNCITKNCVVYFDPYTHQPVFEFICAARINDTGTSCGSSCPTC